MEIFKNLIHEGGEETQSKGNIRGSCALIALHKSTFDRSKARRVNPDLRSFSIFSVHASRLAPHSCAYHKSL